jgi:hypothetical protein
MGNMRQSTPVRGSARGATIAALVAASLLCGSSASFGGQATGPAARGQQFGSIAITIGMSEFDAIAKLSEEFSVARVASVPGLLMIRSKQSPDDSVGAVNIRNGRVTSITSDWTPGVDRASALADVLFTLLSKLTARKQAGWRSASACSIAVTDTPITVPDTPVRMVEIACDRQTIRLSMSRVTGGGSHVEVALVIE